MLKAWLPLHSQPEHPIWLPKPIQSARCLLKYNPATLWLAKMYYCAACTLT